MSVLTEKMNQLILSLREATRGGRVRWQATDSPGTFAYVGESGSVLIESGAFGLTPSIRVLDVEGNLVDSYEGVSSDLRALYGLAERQVVEDSKDPRVLDALIAELAEAAGSS